MEHPFDGLSNCLNGHFKWPLTITELTKDGIQVFFEDALRSLRILNVLYDLWPARGFLVHCRGIAQQDENIP